VTPEVVAIGGSVRVEIDLENPSPAEAGALVDVIVQFVKANGSTSPKVFKGAEVSLRPGEGTTVSKSVSVRQHSTRTHYPGRHEVEVQLNGRVVPGAGFDLTP
jgi:hypothetical protein